MPIFRRIARPNPCFAESAHQERVLFKNPQLFEESVNPTKMFFVLGLADPLMIPAQSAGFFCPPVLDHHENYSLY